MVILVRGRATVWRGALELACSIRGGALRRCKLDHMSTCEWSYDRFRTITTTTKSLFVR